MRIIFQKYSIMKKYLKFFFLFFSRRDKFLMNNRKWKKSKKEKELEFIRSFLFVSLVEWKFSNNSELFITFILINFFIRFSLFEKFLDFFAHRCNLSHRERKIHSRNFCERWKVAVRWSEIHGTRNDREFSIQNLISYFFIRNLREFRELITMK